MIEFLKEELKGSMSSIWRGECKVLPGGFRLLDCGLQAGELVPAGAFVKVDFDNKTAELITTISGTYTRTEQQEVRDPETKNVVIDENTGKPVMETVEVERQYIKYPNAVLAADFVYKGDGMLNVVDVAYEAVILYDRSWTFGRMYDNLSEAEREGMNFVDFCLEVRYAWSNNEHADEQGAGTAGGRGHSPMCLACNPNILMIKQ